MWEFFCALLQAFKKRKYLFRDFHELKGSVGRDYQPGDAF